MSRTWPYYVGPGRDDRCGGGVNTGHGCGHPRDTHRTNGTGRCMEGVGQPGWRCDCLAFDGEAVPTIPPGTPRRTIRVADALWETAVIKAAGRGESVSDVIRRALERYVRRP